MTKISNEREAEVMVKRNILFKQIGAKINYYRNLMGIKQDDLARRVHISRSALSRIENGHYDSAISIDLLIDLAEVMNIDFRLLIDFNEVEEKMWLMESVS